MSEPRTTTVRKAELLEQRNSLRHRIALWRDIQSTYMPGVEQVRSAPEHSPKDVPPEAECLFLPSSLPPALTDTACVRGLAEKERRLRLGQAEDALHDIRRQLRVASTIIEFKKGQHHASQSLTTKTRHLMATFTGKTKRCANRYDAAYAALQSLDPNGEWTRRFRPLNHSLDLHLPRREADDPRGENRRQLSWIWLVSRDGEQPRGSATEVEVSDSESNTSNSFRTYSSPSYYSDTS